MHRYGCTKVLSWISERACRIWWDPRGSWTREYVDGKTGLSKEEEISTIEIEGDKIYEVMYIMGMEATRRLQPRPRRLDSKHK